MCGIGGILRTDGQPIPEEWLDAIDARIAYRGPDGHGRFRDRVEIDIPGTPALRAGSAGEASGSEIRGTKRVVEVAFVHRRLSIIDHKDGHQPMVSERGRNDKEGLVAVVFNGCIYNHRELRKELEAKGHTFVTDHSDTEVLIHGWREWSDTLTDHLEGMYAFAVWDRQRGALMLARDWFGEKPLYYTTHGEAPVVTAFASESSSLAVIHPDATPDGDRWIDDYLQSGAACCQPTAVSIQPALSFVSDTEPNDDHESRPRGVWRPKHPIVASDVERLLELAVRRRLEADVPLGCFLSGGTDSSLIAHFAMKHLPGLRTFSVRMPDPRYDESSHANAVATCLKTSHTTLDVRPSPAEDLQNLVGILGEPFGDSSILPTYWISMAARQHVKVALSGDGGDELFIGYERYLAARPMTRYRRLLRLVPSSPLLRAHPKSSLHKFARACDMARDHAFLGVAALTSVFGVRDIAALTGHDPPDRIEWNSRADALAGLRAYDIENYLPNDLLRKVDTASMACGLEVRCPFLDRDLARAALAAPIEQLMPGGQRKGLLRQIARKYLPKEIVDRPKMGFAIPIGEWFRSDYGGMKTLLLDHLNSAEPFGPIQLNRKAVQRFIDEHMSGKRDHGQRLFTLLTLSIWARQVAK